MTLFSAFARTAAQLGHRPAVTYLDARTGERTELSYATLHNWAAKVANLCADEWQLGEGGVLTIDLPLHWVAPALALGAWGAGAAVAVGDAASRSPGRRVAAELEDPLADLVVGAGPGGLAEGEVAGLSLADVLAQPDDFPLDGRMPEAPAVASWTHAALAGAPVAQRLLHAADRVSETTLTLVGRVLPAGGSLVLARGYPAADLGHVADSERATLARPADH